MSVGGGVVQGFYGFLTQRGSGMWSLLPYGVLGGPTCNELLEDPLRV